MHKYTCLFIYVFIHSFIIYLLFIYMYTYHVFIFIIGEDLLFKIISFFQFLMTILGYPSDLDEFSEDPVKLRVHS